MKKKHLKIASLLLGAVMAFSLASCGPTENSGSGSGSGSGDNPGGDTAIADTEIFEGRQSILLMGQSNMAGRGDLSTVEAIDNDRIYMQNQSLTWTKMVEPIHYDKPGQAGVGLGASFADAFVNTFDVEVGLVPCAMGGSSIDDWAVDGTLYNNTIERAQAAQADSEICAILWHQGCSNEDNYDGYAEKFQIIMDSLMYDLELDAEKIIIVSGELGTFRDNDTSGITSELYRISDYYDNYAVTSSQGLTAVDVTTHFDGPSLRVFGYRYFANFYDLLTGRTFYDYSENPDDYLYVEKVEAGLIEAESCSTKVDNSSNGQALKTTAGAGENGSDAITHTGSGDYLIYKDIYFNGTPSFFAVNHAGPASASAIEICIDDLNTTLAKIDTVPASLANSYTAFRTSIVEVTYAGSLSGYHDVYLKLAPDVNIDWFELTKGNVFTVEATNVNITEGDTAEIVVTRMGDTTNEASVTVETVAGTATADTCFTAISQEVTFAAGETTKTVSVTTKVNELTNDGDIYFDVKLKNPSADETVLTKGNSVRINMTSGKMVKILVSEDTRVEKGNASVNYGSDINMRVREQGDSNSFTRRVLLKFNISTLTVDSNGKIYLVVYCDFINDGMANTLYVYGCTNDWEEMTVTWNTKPTQGAEVGSAVAADASEIKVDVTDYVKAAITTGDTEISLMLCGKSGAACNINMHTKETGSGKQAYLLQE